MHRVPGLTLAEWPVARPPGWLATVNAATSEETLAELRHCVQRGHPLGPAAWVRATAARLGLGFTLRGPARPHKPANNQ
jgi:hypothetical protein